MNWNEAEMRIEASFGGRMDEAEMRVFAEELRDLVSEIEDQPYLLMIDHSKAKSLDRQAAD
ncbi:MAG TPA: hypothetical protein VM328_03245, partial [Fimbriimonadaceae bacterium]|nr:hypothetical protein [Fimbriimonadaceae bacterium]